MRTKTLFLTCGATALAMLAALSCTKEEEPAGTPGQDGTSTELTAPALSADKETVTLTADAADQTALTLEWTAAKAGETDAEATYALYINLSSKDIFTTPYTKDLGSGLSASFTNAELNAILVDELGAEAGKATDIQVMVYATPADEELEAVQSNKVALNVTSYVEPVVFPEALVAAGSAIGSNDRSKGVTISKTGEGVYKAENVKIWTSNDAALKFYPDDETSEWCVVAKTSEDYKDMTVEVEYVKAPEGGDIYVSRITDFAFGAYTVEVNLTAGTLTLTRTADVNVSDLELPEELYMRGDALADIKWDWPVSKENALKKTADKVYEAKGIRLDFGGDGTMGFNVFTGYEADNPMLGMAATSTNGNIVIALAATGEDRFRPGTIGYEGGIYDIKMDFNNSTMTLTAEENVPIGMSGTLTNWEMISVPQINDHEWEITGVEFTDVDESSNLKFYPNYYKGGDQWWPYYGQVYVEDETEFGKITSIPDQATVDASVETNNYDPAFYPGRFGYTAGTYTINVNTETMKVTLTKED